MQFLILILSLATFNHVYCTDKNVTMVYKETIQLNCSALCNWYKVSGGVAQLISTGGKFTVDSTAGTLTITDLRKEELTQKYFCNTSSLADTYIPQPKPFFYAAAKSSITVTESGSADITCQLIVGYQLENVTWKWLKPDGIAVDTSNTKYTIANSGDGSSISKLTIKPVSTSDKGDYTCVATNTAGNSTQTVTLRVKNTLAALWPFLAIVGEVIILCIIILVYEKKFAKKSNTTTEDKEQTKNLMEKQGENSNSDLKKRTAKA